MRKQVLALALVLGVVLAFQFACIVYTGPSTPIFPENQTTGAVAIYGGDVPACGIISFNMTFTGITLTPGAGGTPVSVLASGQPLTVDFASLMGSYAPMALTDIPVGAYSQLNLTLSAAQLTYWNSSLGGPTTLKLTLSSLDFSVALNPQVIVSTSAATALALDFDMLHSIVLDQNGQITSNVQPQFFVTQASLGSDNTFATIEDVRGVVNSVATTSSLAAYTGSFVLTPATGPNLTVYVSNSTQFAGVSDVSGLTPNTYIQIAAVLDSNGHLLASQIQAEAVEDAAAGQGAFRGTVSGITRDSSGNATGFNLLVNEEIPDLHTQAPLQSVLAVNISPSTNLAITAQSQSADFAGFLFGPQSLGVGQVLVAHGQLPAAGSTPFAAQASAIYLGTQPVLGNLQTGPTTPLVLNNGNPKIGGFGFAPCSAIYPPIMTAITSAQTAFTGLTDLTTLRTPGISTLLVKGMLLFQQDPAVVLGNPVTWIPAATLEQATEVRQLQ